MLRKIFKLIMLFTLLISACQPAIMTTVNTPSLSPHLSLHPSPFTRHLPGGELKRPNGTITSTNTSANSKTLAFSINYGSVRKGFNTKAIDCDLISSVKVSISGINISSPITANATVGANCTFNASVLNVPYGKARIATVEAYDSDSELIPGATIKAVFDIGSDPVNAEISFKSTPNAQIIENLIGVSAKQDLLATNINLADLATLVNNITGVNDSFPDYTYSTHPSLVNSSAIATDLISNNGDVSVLNSANAGYKISPATVTGTIAGLVDTDTVDIRVDDPAGNVLITQDNSGFTVNNVTPGSWKVYFSVDGQIDYTAVTPISTGNVVTTKDIGTITFEPANTPEITNVNPTSGKIGDVITIAGNNFYPANNGNVVTFGSVNATNVTYNSGDGTIQAAVPGGLSNGNQDITVTVSNKTSNEKTFNFIADIIYVSTSASGDNTGDSWNNAYRDLQTALANAASGYEIWVAKGTYKPGTLRTDIFQLKNGVKIYGGFAGNENLLSERVADGTDGNKYLTNEVILSGDINNNFSNDNGDSYHVVTGITGATLDGVTIKLGFANGGGSDGNGAGMYNTGGSSPTLTNVTFSNNRASQGGGMYNVNGSSPTLNNVTFSNNRADTNGGGMYNIGPEPTLTNVTFSNNIARQGGGMFNFIFSSPTLTNVTFSNNNAVNGGGMYNVNGSSPTLNNVTFSNNRADTNGGGMYNDDRSSPTLTNVTFSNNRADTAGGGGMYNFNNSSPTLTNVTFSGNSAAGGGGMYNAGSSPTLTNVTFSGNSAAGGGGGMYNQISSPTVKNTIFWHNNIYNNNNSTLKIGFSDVDGGFSGIANENNSFIKDLDGNDITDDTTYSAAGNINEDPLFNADLSLQDGSPVIDKGTSVGAPLTDITGKARDEHPDMGAYEF